MIDDTTEQRSKHRNRYGCNGLPFNKRGPKAKQTEEKTKKTKRVLPEEETKTETKKTKRVQPVQMQEAEKKWHCRTCNSGKIKSKRHHMLLKVHREDKTEDFI